MITARSARSIRPTTGRAAALAIAALLALPGLAAADDVTLTGADVVVVGGGPTIDLGDVAPSSVHNLSILFTLTCVNGEHVDPGQTVNLDFASGIQPEDGLIGAVSIAEVGPAPSDWPADGVNCPTPTPNLAATVPTTIELRAPSVTGDDHTFLLSWAMSLSPAGNLDSFAVRGNTSLTVIMDVVSNTPPALVLPPDMTVEGNTVGGWTAAFSATATDLEDTPDPTPTCDVAPGTILLLGPTTIGCSVTDTGGMTDEGSFTVTVVDTTAPTLTAPADQAVTTNDPTGATLAYDLPIAADVVDPAPTVECTPASWSAIPLGTTSVTCTATDASANNTVVAFDATVTFVDPRVATARWGEPIGADGGSAAFVANRGRTLPLKVTLAIDGVVQMHGGATLQIEPCGGGTALVLPLSFSGGRWSAALDTSDLTGSCQVVRAVIDDLVAGSFSLHLRGSEAATSNNKTRGR